MPINYFFDLPVYRLPESSYYAEFKRYVQEVIFPPGTLQGQYLRKLENSDPSAFSDVVNRNLEGYGGIWRYNEIVGYIRLHFLGTQVRGEYFAPNRRRIMRTRTRTLEFRTWKLAPEEEIATPITTDSVRKSVESYIKACRKELGKRYIDTTLFESLAPHIDWLSLYESDA